MLKYVGGGAYIPNVPARDLTDDEAKEFAKVINEQKKLTGVVLYVPVKDDKKKGDL